MGAIKTIRRIVRGPGKVGDNSSGYTIPGVDYEYAATPGAAVGEQVASAVTDAFANALSAQLDKESETDQTDKETKDKAVQSDYDQAKTAKQKAKQNLKDARQKRKEKRQAPRLKRQAERKQKRADRINSKL
jgi:Skp family chaperone for outer membrane proteins